MKPSQTLKPVCAVFARTDYFWFFGGAPPPTCFRLSLRLISVPEIRVGDHADLEVGLRARDIDFVVDRQLQFGQQLPPASGVVVDGDGVPALRPGRAIGIELIGAFGLNTK